MVTPRQAAPSSINTAAVVGSRILRTEISQKYIYNINIFYGNAFINNFIYHK